MTPEHAQKHGFVKSDMSDHEFAAFIRKHDLTHRQHLAGTVWTGKSDNTVAVVTYDNAAPSRDIWIKEEYHGT